MASPSGTGGTETVLTFDQGTVNVGDVIAYRGEGKARLSDVPDDSARDWLTVSRVDEHGIHGFRVNPQEWEHDQEYVVVPQQIENNGVFIHAR